jgi:hypothetical protein
VAGFTSPSRHTLIAAVDAERLTGLRPDLLLAERDVQEFIRVGADGRREEMLRVPLELVAGSEETAADAA